MITISETVIPPVMALGVPIGRTHDVEIIRGEAGFDTYDGSPLLSIQREFLAILDEIVPDGFDYGTMFARGLEPRATSANETHRDKTGRDQINAICFVALGESVQHEFFADDDFWEDSPQVVPNGHVILFTKDLHRRPERAEGSGPKVFLSATLCRRFSDVVVATDAEPYICHGGVLG